MPWRSSSLESRCRQRIRSTRTASRARTRSRNASSSSPGTLTGCSFPASSSRASNSASRRSVFTRSPLARGILLGAATTHSTPRFASSRASPYPVGPASYATLAGRGNPAQKPAAPALSPLIVNVCSSPVSASSTTATIFAACTSKPTRVLAFVMAGSSYAIVVAARVRAAQHEHHPTNSMGEPASSTPPAGQTSNPYCLAPQQVVHDQVDQLDADERRDDPAEAVDPEVASQQRTRADRPVAHAAQRQRDQQRDHERVEDDRGDGRRLRGDGVHDVEHVQRTLWAGTGSCRVGADEDSGQDREVLGDVVRDREGRQRAAGDQELLADLDDLDQLRRVGVEVDHVP